MCSSTGISPRRPTVNPTVSSPRLPVLNRRPMETNIFSASTLWPFSNVVVTPSAATDTLSTRVPVKIVTPCFFSSAARSADTSWSSSGRIRGSISTIVTGEPSALYSEANSQPSTPPPTINSEGGISVKSRISRLLTTHVPFNGRLGRDGAVVPVPRITASPVTAPTMMICLVCAMLRLVGVCLQEGLVGFGIHEIVHFRRILQFDLRHPSLSIGILVGQFRAVGQRLIHFRHRPADRRVQGRR